MHIVGVCGTPGCACCHASNSAGVPSEAKIVQLGTAITINQGAAQADPTNGGFVFGGGRYLAGTNVTVMAIADTNTMPFQFQWWSTVFGQILSTNYEYIFTVGGNESLAARFDLPYFSINASSDSAICSINSLCSSLTRDSQGPVAGSS